MSNMMRIVNEVSTLCGRGQVAPEGLQHIITRLSDLVQEAHFEGAQDGQNAAKIDPSTRRIFNRLSDLVQKAYFAGLIDGENYKKDNKDVS